MPIPKPRKDEEKDEFISRCMGDDVMVQEYPDRTQRIAVCYSSWRRRKDVGKSTQIAKFEDLVDVVKYSKEGYPFVRCDAAASDVKLEATAKGDIVAKGWFTTELVNTHRQRVLASAFAWDGAFDAFNGRVLAFHDSEREPVGAVMSYEVRNIDGQKKGIYGEFKLFKENSPIFMRAVREGVLKDLSIGFNVVDWTYDEEEGVVTFKKGYLGELSIVNQGAAHEAKFEIINSIPLIKDAADSGSKAPTTKKRRSTLDPEMEKRLNAIEQNSAKSVNQEKAIKELRECYNGVKEGLAQFKAGIYTKDELSEKFDKISEKFNRVTDDLEAAKRLADTRKNYIVYKDMKSLLSDDSIIWLTDDNGVAMRPIDQRAYRLFQMPVDYDKLDCGQELLNLRNLHDAVVFWNAYMRFRKGGNYHIEQSRLWTNLVAAVKSFDETIYNAMAGGNAGYGAEFVPQELSSEFNELLRIAPTVSAQFDTWQMPRSGSAYYPFQNGRAVAYKGSEAAVNNPVEARKTSTATGRKLFTPTTFIGALVSSEELSEDSIVDMQAFIRKELATVMIEKLDSTIINGDSTSPHQDNGEATVYETYDLETCFIGLRAMSIDDGTTHDVEVLASDTGVGALTVGSFSEMKKDMGVAGVRPDQCFYVTGVKGRSEVQKALWKEDASGILAYIISGKLPPIDGSQIVVSAMYNEALESDGMAGTDADHTSICCAHKPSWRIAQRRGVTIEFDKNILTQQQAFVSTARFDFGKICADEIKPVASAINVQHT